MLSYWFPAPVSFWWPLAFTIIFAAAGVFAVYAALARRAEEPDAALIALLYGIGFGLIAVTEFMMYLDVAFGVSLAAAFAMSTGIVTFFAIAAAVVAVLALVAGGALQYREERSYRVMHPAV
jgi:hypothetical protein